MSEAGKRKVCTILVDRANYGRLWPVMKTIQNSPKLELITVCAGTMVLPRFGQAEKIVEADGFNVDSRVFLELEGSTPTTMAKSIGLAVIEFSNEFLRLKPDIILMIGDRYEALAAAIAASYMNIPIAHIQGGEVSGSIDESARHAISKFSQYHFPSTKRSAEFLVKMGENPDTVFHVGCPSGDYIKNLETDLPRDVFTKIGVGAQFEPSEDFFMVIYHPVTTRYGTERQNVDELIYALAKIKKPTVWIWPNIDAGSDDISKGLRMYREHNDNDWLHLVKNFEPREFQKCIKRAVCLIGNSSSFVRDSTFSGTPVVLVGERQKGREYAENLMFAEPNRDSIQSAIETQLKHGRYKPSVLYGDGNASQRIVEKLEGIKLYTEKTLHYIHR